MVELWAAFNYLANLRLLATLSSLGLVLSVLDFTENLKKRFSLIRLEKLKSKMAHFCALLEKLALYYDD